MVCESEVYVFHLKANGYLLTFQKGNSRKIFQFGHPRTDGCFGECGSNFLVMTNPSSMSNSPVRHLARTLFYWPHCASSGSTWVCLTTASYRALYPYLSRCDLTDRRLRWAVNCYGYSGWLKDLSLASCCPLCNCKVRFCYLHYLKSAATTLFWIDCAIHEDTPLCWHAQIQSLDLTQYKASTNSVKLYRITPGECWPQ